MVVNLEAIVSDIASLIKWLTQTSSFFAFYLLFLLPSFLEAVLEAVRQKTIALFKNRTIAIKTQSVFSYDRITANSNYHIKVVRLKIVDEINSILFYSITCETLSLFV